MTHETPDGRVVPGAPLNARDVQVLRCLAVGQSTAQIAAALGVSRNTARTRIRRVSAKLAVEGRGEAVRAAGLHGVVGVPSPRRPVG